MSVKLHFYSNIYDNFDVLKDTGILSNERIDDIKSWIAPEMFEIPRLEGGRTIAGWKVHKLTNLMHHESQFNEWGLYGVYNATLEKLLEPQEIDALNDRASSEWSRKIHLQRFNKAQKIPAKDYSGWVCDDGDNYYESVQDYLDNHEENQDLGEFPNYVWGTHSKSCCKINLDNVLENASCDAYEEYNGPIGVEELKEAIDEFNELNGDDLSFECNYNVVVIFGVTPHIDTK